MGFWKSVGNFFFSRVGGCSSRGGGGSSCNCDWKEMSRKMDELKNDNNAGHYRIVDAIQDSSKDSRFYKRWSFVFGGIAACQILVDIKRKIFVGKDDGGKSDGGKSAAVASSSLSAAS